MKKWKRALLSGLAVMACAGILAGCAETHQEASAPEPTVSMRNDGREAELVLGELAASPERTAALKEIVEKYRSDFPNTQVEVRSFDTRDSLLSALRAGELDIAEIDGDSQLELVKEDLLLDIYLYLKAWDESSTLTFAAKRGACSLGQERAYLIPVSFTQDLLYYRSDWFDEFNEGKNTGLVHCLSWGQIAGEERNGEFFPGVAQKLGDRGKLAFAGKEKLLDYFDAMVWSSLGLNYMADPAAAYFSLSDEGKSIFTLERAQAGVDEFLRVMERNALPGALDWTEEQALDAFINGEAALVIADRSAAEKLSQAMPEGSWAASSFPRGRAGVALFRQEFTGWAVSSSTKDPEITAHFLTFLCNADNNTHYAKVCGELPIHLGASDMEPSFLEGDLAVEVSMINQGERYQYASEPFMYKAYEGYREQAGEKVRQFARGELSRDKLLAYLDEYWNSAYAEEGKLWGAE